MKMTLKELVETVNKQLEMNPENEMVSKDKRVKQKLTERRVRSYIASGSLHKPIRLGGNIWYDETHVNTLLATRKFLNNGVSDSAIKSFSNMYYQTSEKSDDVDTVSNGSAIKAGAVLESWNLDDVFNVQEYTDSKAIPVSSVMENNSNVSLNSDEERKVSLQDFLKDIAVKQEIQNKIQSVAALSRGSRALSGSNNSVTNNVSAMGPLVGACDALKDNILDSFQLLKKDVSNVIVNSQSLGRANVLESSLSQVVTTSRSIQEHKIDEAGKIFLRIEDGANISNPEVVLEKIKQILNIKG